MRVGTSAMNGMRIYEVLKQSHVIVIGNLVSRAITIVYFFLWSSLCGFYILVTKYATEPVVVMSILTSVKRSGRNEGQANGLPIRWVFICPELAGQITVLLVLQQRLHVWTWSYSARSILGQSPP